MQLLDYKGVAQKLAIHPRSVYGMAQADPSFPSAVKLSGARTRWVEEEIDQWIVNNRRNKNDDSDQTLRDRAE